MSDVEHGDFARTVKNVFTSSYEILNNVLMGCLLEFSYILYEKEIITEPVPSQKTLVKL